MNFAKTWLSFCRHVAVDGKDLSAKKIFFTVRGASARLVAGFQRFAGTFHEEFVRAGVTLAAGLVFNAGRHAHAKDVTAAVIRLFVQIKTKQVLALKIVFDGLKKWREIDLRGGTQRRS